MDAVDISGCRQKFSQYKHLHDDRREGLTEEHEVASNFLSLVNVYQPEKKKQLDSSYLHPHNQFHSITITKWP